MIMYWCFYPATHHANIVEHRSLAAKKPMRRMLIKEYSLDSYTWQRKYAHLTSSITRAAVDEKLRRFSVSASMEEISKQANNNENMGSQVRTNARAKTKVYLHTFGSKGTRDLLTKPRVFVESGSRAGRLGTIATLWPIDRRMEQQTVAFQINEPIERGKCPPTSNQS